MPINEGEVPNFGPTGGLVCKLHTFEIYRPAIRFSIGTNTKNFNLAENAWQWEFLKESDVLRLETLDFSGSASKKTLYLPKFGFL